MSSFTIEPGAGSVVSMAVAPGGERIAVGLGPEIRLVDRAGNLLGRAPTDNVSGTLPVAFTASGAVVAGAANVVYVLEGGAARRIEGKFDASRSPILAIAEVAPGIVVTGHGDGALRRVDLAAEKFERSGYKAHKRCVRVVARGSEPGTFVTSADDQLVAEWHEAEKAPRRVHEKVGYAKAIDVDRMRTLVVASNGALALRSLVDGDACPIPVRHYSPPAAFARDGILAVAGADDEVVVVDVRGAVIARHRDPGAPSAIAIEGETLFVARGLAVSAIPLVSRRRFTPREIRARHASSVSRLLPLPDGFASHASDQALKLWSSDGTFRGGVRLDHGGIDAAASTRTTLLLATSRGELLTLDATTSAIVHRASLSKVRAWSVAGPDDGSWIAGTALDNEAARFERGKARATWRRRIGRAHGMLWSESRRRFVLQNEMKLEVLDELGKTLGELPVASLWPGACISPDGARVACFHPAGATVSSLEVLDAPARTLVVPGPDTARTSALAWADDETLWIARGADAVCVSVESGGTVSSAHHGARITAMLDLGGALAIGDERGQITRVAL